jgi:pyruvate,water dikinase
MTDYTARLGDPLDASSAGGKAANLSAMMSAGMPVPRGYVVTTRAYHDFIDAAGLAECDADQLHYLILHADIPETIAIQIRAAYAELGSAAVAVRSSGTAEDLADASFAGQHDTFLNVDGTDAVLGAVRECWASLWTPRAIAYREQSSWDERGLGIAVVVQEMVHAEYAGVMFTADPVSGRLDRIVIEAVRGLGDALVSGQASGQHWVVDKATGALASGESVISETLISESALKQLVALGRAAEDRFGTPQDIEWTCLDNNIALVQARPLTGLTGRRDKTEQRPNADTARKHRSTIDFSITADHMPYPPFPMDASLVFRPVMAAVLRGIVASGLDVPPLHEVVVEIDDGVVQIVPPRLRPRLRALWQAPAASPGLVRLVRTPSSNWRACADSSVRIRAIDLDRQDLTNRTDDELVELCRGLLHDLGTLMPSRFGIVVRGTITEVLAVGLLRVVLGRARAESMRADLMLNVPSVTSAANADLERIASIVRSDPRLRDIYLNVAASAVPARLRRSAAGRAILAEVDAHLDRYGFRELSIITVGLPPLRDAPWVVHGIITGLTRRQDAGIQSADDRLQQARSQLASIRGLRGSALRRPITRLLAAARSTAELREDSYYLIVTVMAVARRLLGELGRRLVEHGILTAADDIAYLELDELEALSAQRTPRIVERRKAARVAALDHYTAVPAELLERRGDRDGVRGVPASRGRFVGPVRIVHDETEFARIEAGDVLVCPYTNPIWTPLFSIAGAVVTDTGGMASHAAIVAREQGIPAVMGTGNASRVLTDGQRVLVDADRGIVVPIG